MRRAHAVSGKWSEPGVPHKGWTCTDVQDLEEPSAVCEMCETQTIRYVHHMQHPDHPEELAVGCICAKHMEEDYEAPKRRERHLRNAAQRKKRWLGRNWKLSAQRNAYLNTDGLNIVIYRHRISWWGARITDRKTNRSIASKKRYATEDQAKLAAFDGMIFLKKERGWGR